MDTAPQKPAGLNLFLK